MHVAGPELDTDAIELGGGYTASNSVPRFKDEVRDVPLCEDLGSSDARYSSTDNDNLVAVCLHS